MECIIISREYIERVYRESIRSNRSFSHTIGDRRNINTTSEVSVN